MNSGSSGHGSTVETTVPIEGVESDRAKGDITLILSRIEHGEPCASEDLLPLVYKELRKLASIKLAQEKPGQTLQATALVHEAYLRLVDPEKVQHWNSRAHFYSAAAKAMHRILVSNARRKHAAKRGGDLDRLEVDVALIPAESRDEKLLALDDALDRLGKMDCRLAELVRLRYFAGLTMREVAQVLGVSTATADRDWAYARAWLQDQMDPTGG